MPEKIAVGMEVNGIQRNFFDQSCQLFLVIRLMSDAFLQFAATNECKRRLCNERHNRVSFVP